MESIQTYASTDSDSESEVEYNNDSSNKDSLVPFEKSPTKMNFFGLNTMTSLLSSTNSNGFISEKELESRHENENSSFSIPEGDFWKGFVPEAINTVSVKHDVHAVKERTSENNFKKRPHSGENSLYRNTGNKKLAFSSGSNCSSEGSTNLHSHANVVQQESRKIFYVHSKITPFLTTRNSCKCASKPNSSWKAHLQAVNRVSWNRSNYSHLLLTAGMDSSVKVWNVWSCLDRCVSTLIHHTKAVRNAMWGMQGRSIISCSYDKTAIVTDVESGAIQSRHIHPGFVVACTLHPNNPNCFVTGSENLIQFWDIRTPLAPVKVLTYKDDMGQPQDLLFIQNGNELISCSDIVSRDSSDRTIMAWDVKSGSVISNQIYQEKYTCTRLKKCLLDSKFAAQTQGGYVALFSSTRPYRMDKNKRFEGHKMEGYNIGFDISHDGSLLYSGSAEGGVHCYDYKSGRLLRKFSNDSNDVVTDVACHPVLSTLVASCTWGGSLALWQ